MSNLTINFNNIFLLTFYRCNHTFHQFISMYTKNMIFSYIKQGFNMFIRVYTRIFWSNDQGKNQTFYSRYNDPK